LDMSAMYKIVVESWSRSGHSGSARRAEEILDNMQSCYEAGDSSVKPSIEVFNSVIHAYAQSRTVDATQQALRVFQKLHDLKATWKTDVIPNQKSYAGLLLAHANSGGIDAPTMVKQLLDRMDSLSGGEFRPDYNCHNVYLSSLVGIMSYSCISRSETAELADSYLREMLESPRESERPDVWSFNIVLAAWSKSDDKAMVFRSEALIDALEAYHVNQGLSEKTQPNTNTYNTLMACYSRSQHSDKALRARQVLKKMKQLAEKGVEACRPDHITYNTVMNAHAKSREPDSPQKVEDLLLELQQLYETTGDRCLKPTIRSFYACVSVSFVLVMLNGTTTV
jgi:pentatricopeptide repeat protein